MVRFTVLASGSKGNATVLFGGRTRILEDAEASDEQRGQVSRFPTLATVERRKDGAPGKWEPTHEEI